jgi:hypothetical protein
MESERRNIEEGGRGRSSECSNRARDCDRANLSFGCPFVRPTGSLKKIINKTRWAGIGNLIWRQKHKLNWPVRSPHRLPQIHYITKEPIDSHNK